MSIPYLKGWGASIKDAAEELTPAIKSLKNQNWQQHEAISQALLDPKKRQEFANFYADNPDAFPEEIYGKKNVEQIRSFSQDPAFALKRATERAGLTVAADPKNTADIGGVAVGIGTTAQRDSQSAGATVAKNEAAISEQIRNAYKLLPPDVQAKWDKDAAMRKYVGMTSDEQEARTLALNEAKAVEARNTTAQEWLRANSKKYGTTVDIAKGILDGSIPPDMQAGIINNPALGAGVKVQLEKIENEGRQAAAVAAQLRGIEAQGAMLDQRQKFQLEQAELVAKQAQQAAGIKMKLNITSKLDGILKGSHSEDELKNSLMPGLQAELDQYAQITGTPPAKLSVINPWWGKPYIAFQSGKDGKLKPINSINFSEAGPAPVAPSENKPPTLDEQFLERYKGASLAEQNQYYERGNPELKAKIDQWIKEGKIPDPRQPGGK